jgi:phospholipase C
MVDHVKKSNNTFPDILFVKKDEFVTPVHRDSSPIKHIFAIMLENRSFDQIFGYRSNKEEPFKVDGINYNQPRSNIGLADDNKMPISFSQSPIEMFSGEDHCSHNFGCVMHSIGSQSEMSGFISAQQYVSNMKLSADGYYYELDNDPLNGHISPKEIMGYFPEGSLSVFDYLADNFTVCDRWFSSVPAGTYTNRVFSLTADSKGEVFNSCSQHSHVVYDQPSIFDRLSEAKVSWRSYWNDIPSTLLLHKNKSLEYLGNQRNFSNFKNDVSKHATRPYEPYFTVIDPTFIYEADNGKVNPYEHMIGQRLVATVYDAIRDNDKLWRSSLIVVYYDEAGGFYDHVPPPKCIPPHDDYIDENGDVTIGGTYKHWSFNQYGIRVPALLISPFIKPGVDHELYDHSSLLAYMLRDLGLKHLSNRDLLANDFSKTLLSTPRDVPYVSTLQLFEKTRMTHKYPLDGTIRKSVSQRGQDFIDQIKVNLGTAAVEFLSLLSKFSLQL